MKTEVQSEKQEGLGYTSVVTEYKHKCKDDSFKDLHKNEEEPKPVEV